jgi:thioredoxin reductase/Pyruvate/2-oxoacid:ferredoxin oxidoreductase delta subunit
VTLALLGGALTGALALGAALVRRQELLRTREVLALRRRAERSGAAEPRLQHPVIDLSRCLGCGTCVAACPEDGVLELVHGQAVVVRAARCVGVAACERECPVGAVTVTVANLATRTDVPALTESLEAVGRPGVFLAGEVTAFALVRVAIEQGVRAVREVALRRAGPLPLAHSTGAPAPPALDVVIVGAGPAGLAASLEARRIGLSFVTLEQENGPGGTVAKYPRNKLVISEPVELPLFGRLRRDAYHKEELIALWTELADRHDLPIRYGERLQRLDRDEAAGTYTAWTGTGAFTARCVVFCVGRRGTPNKLGVPGEDLAKVAYGLVDAALHTERRVLVVGGGDSAVEAALALAEQDGNAVTLSYRRAEFHRLRARNAARLEEAQRAGALHVVPQSEVVAITPDEVELTVASGPTLTRTRVPNDEVFVLAGGTPPTELLTAAGVSFDPALRPPPRPSPLTEDAEIINSRDLRRALLAAFVCAATLGLFVLWQRDYYLADAASRATHALHDSLRPGRGFGLLCGVFATLCVVANLGYLLRRARRFGVAFGSLRAWMGVHVATGVGALLLAALHGALAPGHTVGGHAFAALALLVATGAIGRYLYAAVPRAVNGRELELAEVHARLEADGGPDPDPFAEAARREVMALAEARQWRGNLAGRILGLLGVRLDLRRALAGIAARGASQGIERTRLDETIALASRAHRLALEAAHLEDLRALASGWRWLHRWATALLLTLVGLHVVHAFVYGGAAEALAELARAPLGGRTP